MDKVGSTRQTRYDNDIIIAQNIKRITKEFKYKTPGNVHTKCTISYMTSQCHELKQSSADDVNAHNISNSAELDVHVVVL